MNNFTFITPKEAVSLKLKIGSKEKPLEFWEKIARRVAKKCIACGTDLEWKLATTELCFSCTTGEADASNDYEIIQE